MVSVHAALDNMKARQGVIIALIAGALAFSGGCSAQPALSSSESTVHAIYERAGEPAASPSQQLHDIVVFDWAAELELREPVTVDALQLPESAQAGPRGRSSWEAYEREVDTTVELIVSSIRSGLSRNDVREYYEQNLDFFARQDVIVVRVTEWERGRAQASTELHIDETTVRTLQESDDTVVSSALLLHAGEQVVVTRDDGTTAEVRCLSRTEAGVDPFEDVIQAAAAQLADELFLAELTRRIEAARP
ncbi:hypothetical protein M4D51_03690 [Microbacterium sp. p3-SID338]|uniref:hypothetical protein n=1 Tax=unclassified Microbacterium TaxID=2609290 RepID=UPI0011AED6EF|nr:MULTISPECIES: hypothetical protein [unclassified Microbacterium]MCT1394820.1 hypothetical protein [Microbacterium sp. p3-SID338]